MPKGAERPTFPGAAKRSSGRAPGPPAARKQQRGSPPDLPSQQSHPLLPKFIIPNHSYVDKAYAKAGTELNLVVRGKPQKAVVTKMPFVQTTYYKG